MATLAEKGVCELVEAARIVKSQRKACFQLAGEQDAGNPSSISDAKIAEWKKEGAVDLLGHVESMQDVMSLADIVVLPSYREGTPRSLLEAGALGKPIVATDVPGCREVVSDGFNGLLVPAKDASALASAILELLNNRALAQEMGANGRALVEEEFAVEKIVDQTIDVYSRMGITHS